MKKIFIIPMIIALVVAMVLAAGCAKEKAPEAAFSASPTSGDAPLTVQFTDSSTGEVTAWAWDFDNDGTTDSTAQSPPHIYDTAGNYTVSLTVTGPDGSDTETRTNYIAVTTPAPTSYWTYNVHYERTQPDEYSEDTVRNITLVESDVLPTHLASSAVAIPEVTSNHLFLDYRFGNTTPSRLNSDSPAPVEQYSMDRFVSTADGTQVYEYVTGLALGLPLEVELVYGNYTLLSGSNIGLPYAVNSSWSYNVTTEPSIGGQSYGARTESLTAIVTAENVEVTVDAGTFNDCFQIEIRDAADELLKTLWWSPSVQGLVKLEDVGSYVGLTITQQPLDGMETWELTSYNLI